ncbi:hypothetical protein J1N35_002952 [Gossypium stocksii]|uniref:Retrotransposon gag domain-containing protein n=1 Tax=Gossypium stocksii TaxID=47602 RepID=A0A9D3WM40_9ROSI|nr:hypothetical protein J1N35_002952 [Gossypium stocksii]
MRRLWWSKGRLVHLRRGIAEKDKRARRWLCKLRRLICSEGKDSKIAQMGKLFSHCLRRHIKVSELLIPHGQRLSNHRASKRNEPIAIGVQSVEIRSGHQDRCQVPILLYNNERGIRIEIRTEDVTSNLYRLECPRFDGTNFRGWWLKLEQFFSSECMRDEAKIRGGVQQLYWKVYACGLWDQFSSDTLLDPMSELVTLKQQGSVNQFHDTFVSLLNQIDLAEEHAISVFVSNLKPEIGQYLRLFSPSTLVDGFRLARRIENIISGPMKRSTYNEGAGGPIRPFLPNVKLIQAAEMDDRRKNELCFWCASKYTPVRLSQKVLKPMSFKTVMSNENKGSKNLRLLHLYFLYMPCMVSKGITLCDFSSHWAIRSHHSCGSGSTHNFMDSKLVKRLNLPIEQAVSL